MIKPLQVGDRVVFKLVPTHCQLDTSTMLKRQHTWSKGTISWLPLPPHKNCYYIIPDAFTGLLGGPGADIILANYPVDAKVFGGTVIRYVGKGRKL